MRDHELAMMSLREETKSRQGKKLKDVAVSRPSCPFHVCPSCVHCDERINRWESMSSRRPSMFQAVLSWTSWDDFRIDTMDGQRVDEGLASTTVTSRCRDKIASRVLVGRRCLTIADRHFDDDYKESIKALSSCGWS